MTDEMPAMTGLPPHILLTLRDDMPDVIENDIRAQLDLPGLNLMVMRQPSSTFAGVELYLPTAAGLFIAAGFFNGFLQKAGEDCYGRLKIAAKALWQQTKGVNVTTVGTSGKVSTTRQYSLAYSITGEVVRGLNFKFVIQTDIDPQDAKKGITTFLELIADLHNDRVEKADCEALLTHRPVGGTVLVTYDTTKRKIVPINAFSDRA
jgi:hypothetical protein